MNPLRYGLLPLLLLCFVQPGTAEEKRIDYSDLNYVLETYVNADGFVNYDGLKQDRARLDAFVTQVADLDADGFKALPEPERLAFWINAYNALTLRGVVDHYPLTSFRDLGTWLNPVYKKLKFQVMGQTRSLSDIEHQIIRKQFNEPRIHLAINCGAFDCPRLLNRAYTAKQLEQQFNEQAQHFFGTPNRFAIDREMGLVKLSKIFDWFGSDFEAVYFDPNQFSGLSKAQRAVLTFALPFLSPEDQTYLRKQDYKVIYLDYDWSLNKQP